MLKIEKAIAFKRCFSSFYCAAEHTLSPRRMPVGPAAAAGTQPGGHGRYRTPPISWNTSYREARSPGVGAALNPHGVPRATQLAPESKGNAIHRADKSPLNRIPKTQRSQGPRAAEGVKILAPPTAPKHDLRKQQDSRSDLRHGQEDQLKGTRGRATAPRQRGNGVREAAAHPRLRSDGRVR